jgi:hypothetical protein
MGEPDTDGGKTPGTETETEASTGGVQDIDAVLSQVSALRSEIDRLIALVNTAAKKLEE